MEPFGAFLKSTQRREQSIWGGRELGSEKAVLT